MFTITLADDVKKSVVFSAEQNLLALLQKVCRDRGLVFDPAKLKYRDGSPVGNCDVTLGSLKAREVIYE